MVRILARGVGSVISTHLFSCNRFRFFMIFLGGRIFGGFADALHDVPPLASAPHLAALSC